MNNSKKINNRKKLSVIIIAKNEESKIKDCLESIKDLSNELILVDTGSTDSTKDIAKNYGARIIETTRGGYPDWRNLGLENSKTEWLFYIDADERVTPLLSKEIKNIINNPTSNYAAYAIPRRNFILGKEMKHGGWSPDYVKRLFKSKSLKEWKGKLHEEPVYEGEIGHLENQLIHKKEDSLEDMVKKSNQWTELEAELFYKNGHPPINFFRMIKQPILEIFNRLIMKKGLLDGIEGLILNLFQGWHKFLVYSKLWEMQQNNKK